MTVRLALSALCGTMLALAACEKPATPEPADTHAAKPAENTAPTLATNGPAAAPDLALSAAANHRFGSAAAPARAAGTVRVATYNIENLFDAIDDPALSGRYEDIDDAKPAAHCAAVADAIHAIDADVLALDEIESADALAAFRDEYLSDMGYDYLASPDAGDERGIEQAVLSRYPIVETKQWVHAEIGGVHPDTYGSEPNWHAGEPIRFHRSPLLVTVEVPAAATGAAPYRLSLIAVHQKSGRYGEYWRDREAAATMEIVESIRQSDPGRNLIILGDFNATPTDPCVLTYTTAGMTDLFAGRMGDDAVTHASGRRIDLLLANAALVPEIDPSSAFVYGTTAGPEDMDWDAAKQLPGYASDHFPVAFDLKPVDKAAGG